jgi:hypothetical protein
MAITLNGTTGITTPANTVTGNESVGGNLTVSGTGSVNVTGTVVMGSSFIRNRIINGNMVIDQRNAGASVTPTSTPTYTLDRWELNLSQASKLSVQQNAGSVTPPAGYTKYLGLTSLSAYAVSSTDNFRLDQPIEGFNLADLGWGTASAATITVSFWVRSSLTGSFGFQLNNNAGTRSYPTTYTISAANTWEYKTITIAGDTTGTWETGNLVGVRVGFQLGYGSSLSGTGGSWNAGSPSAVTGATSLVGTSGATFYVTGVQLEVGSSATPYEMQIYSDQLAQCQRYYYVGTNAAYGYPSPNSGGYAYVQRYDYKVTMRTSATVSTTYTSQSNISVINTSTRTADFFMDQIVSTVTTNTTWVVSYTASAEL